MSTNQELRQESVRLVTGTTGTYNEDFLELFALSGFTTGTFNERFYLWLEDRLGLSNSGKTLNELMVDFAIDQGVADWNSLGTITLGTLLQLLQGNLLLSGFAPTTALSANPVASPLVGSLLLDGKVPSISVQVGLVAGPQAGNLLLAGAVPALALSDSKVATPTRGDILLSGAAPTLLKSNFLTVSPAQGNLVLTGAVPEPAAITLLRTFDAWWENDYVGNTKSGTVETWADKTANGNDATQATAGSRPTDGGAYADFDGSDDVLVLDDTVATAFMEAPFQNPGGTFFVVCAPDSDGEGDTGKIWDHAINEEFSTRNESVGALQFYLQTRYQFATATVHSTSTYTVGTVHIIFIRLNKSSGNAGQTWNIDGPTNLTIAGGGLTQDVANSGSSLVPGVDLHIGNRQTSTGNYDGKIHAMGWKAGLMSDADVDTIGTYLASKYSGTWA